MADDGKKVAIGAGVLGLAVLGIWALTREAEAKPPEPPPPPPPGLANLYGIVTDKKTKNPLAGVSVSIWSPDETELLADTYSDNDGYYLLENIYPSNYVVYFAKEGYETEVR